MYHVLGVTPEALTFEQAFGGKAPKRTVVITDQDLQDILQQISEPGGRRIDFAMFGCPHFTLNQVQIIAERIRGKRLAVEMWILTSSHTKEMAARMGLLDTIRAAGGEIIEDTCPDQPCWHYLSGKLGVTDSPKCAYYPKRRGINFVIRDLETCIDAALKGEVA